LKKSNETVSEFCIVICSDPYALVTVMAPAKGLLLRMLSVETSGMVTKYGTSPELFWTRWTKSRWRIRNELDVIDKVSGCRQSPGALLPCHGKQFQAL